MVNTFVGTITAPDATGNQSYTGVGFRPKAILFFGTRQTGEGSSAAIQQIIGMATSGSSRAAICVSDRAAVSPTQCIVLQDNTKCISGTNTEVTTIQEAAEFVSFDSDGFTLNWTSVSAAVPFGYVVIGGAGVQSAAIKEITSPALTGTQAYTGVGFKPDGLIAMSIGSITAPPMATTTEDLYLGFGVASKDSQAASGMFCGDNLATTNTSRWLSTSSLIAIPGASVAERYKASLISLDSDGFTLNWGATAGSGAYAWVLCIKGPQFGLMVATQKTTTGNSSHTGVTFTPKAVLQFGAGNTASTVPAAGARFHVGAAKDASNLFAMAQDSIGNVSPADPNRRRVTNAMIVIIDQNQTTLSVASLASIDGAGVTLNHSVTDGIEREFVIFAIGNPNAGHAFHTFS